MRDRSRESFTIFERATWYNQVSLKRKDYSEKKLG